MTETKKAALTPALVGLAMAIVVGTFVVQINATMINVAFETMRTSFGVALSDLQWVSTIYLLAIAVTVPIVGWATDRFGGRRLWLVGLAVFLVASVGCAFAGGLGMLVVARAVQGVGAGILLTLSQALLAQAAGPERLGRLMGIVGVPSLLGPIVGPIIGGVLVQNGGWQWIFLINIPVCMIALLMAWRWVRLADTGRPTRFDLLGALLLAPGLAALLYGISRAGNQGTIADLLTVLCLASGLILLAGFVVHALVIRHEPLIDVRLFRSAVFSSAAALLFLIIMGLIAGMLLITLYFQLARGESPLTAGLLLVPQGVGVALGIMICSLLVDRGHSEIIALVGAVLATAGLTALTQLGDSTSYVYIGVALLVLGAGFGAVVVSASVAGYRGLKPGEIARAATSLRIFQQVGGSLGVAVLVISLQHSLAAAGAHPASAFGDTFLWATGFVALAVVPALVLVLGKRLRPARASPPARPTGRS